MKSNNNAKWTILILGGLTNALVAALPGMSLSVLLPVISEELNLTIVQTGLAWGIAALPSILAFIPAGLAIDRFGPRRVFIAACILAGLAGAARGLSVNFITLILAIAISGLFSPFIPLSSVKNTRLWFEPHQIGLANGVLSLGMALGFFTGAMISANFVAPAVGGWRNTFFLYGLVAAAFAIPWYFVKSSPPKEISLDRPAMDAPKGNGIRHVARIGNIWLLGLALFCFSGAIQGFLGYVPLYLRGLGWDPLQSDSLAATFHLASLTFTIPITLLSDRLRSRKWIAVAAVILASLGILMFFFLEGRILWAAIITAGLARDGIMAILITIALETKGVGSIHSGVATAFIMILSGIGALIAPPVGNLLAENGLRSPFLFWGLLCLAGAALLTLLKKNQLGRSHKIPRPEIR